MSTLTPTSRDIHGKLTLSAGRLPTAFRVLHVVNNLYVLPNLTINTALIHLLVQYYEHISYTDWAGKDGGRNGGTYVVGDEL